MKVSISYEDDEREWATEALSAVRAVMGKCRVRESNNHPPFKHLYLSARKGSKPCIHAENH